MLHRQLIGGNPSTLCSLCSSIDVENLFIDRLREYTAIKVMSLGKLGVKAELSSCSLCRLFYAVRIQDDSNPSVDDYALYLTRAPYPHFSMGGSVLAVVQETCAAWDKLSFLEYLEHKGASHGFIAYSEQSDTGPHANSLRTRSIDAGSINFDFTIRAWIRSCEQNDKKGCIQVESSAPSIKDMKLIDCELRQIVPALPSYQYSTLSYVWGKSRSVNNDQYVHNILPMTLPRTIEDAISVTQVLGLRYLWIDRYCIDQENDVEKQIQVQQMDLIYQNSFVTIVAAAGTDPYFGLPGVGATPRTPQPSAWIEGRCLVSTLPDPELLIKASKWRQRAWTYQESLLSTRRIIFTEQQVCFECRQGVAHEIVKLVYRTDFVDYSLLGHPVCHENDPSSICNRLGEYCGRELSVDSDAIHAFEGVFHSYRRKNQVHQYLGIPIMPLTTREDLKISHRSRGEAFAAGLSWCNTTPGTRRSLFPTWSWAGWCVPIKYEGHLCSDGLKLGNERPLEVFIEDRDGSLSDMDELSDVFPDQGISSSASKFIHIEAWTIPIDLRYIPNAEEEFRDDERWSNFDFGYVAEFQSDEGVVEFPMHPLYQKHGNDVTTQQSPVLHFKQGSLLGIVLGRCEDFSDLRWSDVIFIMVVQEKEQYHERVGRILLTQDPEPWRRNNYKTPDSVKRKMRSFFHSKKRRTVRLG